MYPGYYCIVTNEIETYIFFGEYEIMDSVRWIVLYKTDKDTEWRVHPQIHSDRRQAKEVGSILKVQSGVCWVAIRNVMVSE